MGLLTDRHGDLDISKIILTTVLTGVTLFSTCGGYCSWANNYEYSRGTRVGVVNKFTNKGLVWKTYEGEMALEGLTSGGSSTGANLWDFSLDSERRHGENIEELARKIQESSEAAQKVRIKYVQPYESWPWRGETGYFVQSVEPVEDKK